jgi:hypothetical protein
MFADWDIGNQPSSNTVNLIDVSTPFARIGDVRSTDGIFMSLGVMGINGEYNGVADAENLFTSLPLFYANENANDPVEIYDDFTNQEKWLTVANNIGARSAGPADISVINGRVVPSLEPGEEAATLFAIGLGETNLEAIAAMRTFVGLVTSVEEPSAASTALMGMPQPNPASDELSVRIGSINRDATLGVFDVLGTRILDLTALLPASGTTSTLRLNVSNLPAGVYYLRLRSGDSTEVRKVVVQ